jgi:hypothetical protein
MLWLPSPAGSLLPEGRGGGGTWRGGSALQTEGGCAARLAAHCSYSQQPSMPARSVLPRLTEAEKPWLCATSWPGCRGSEALLRAQPVLAPRASSLPPAACRGSEPSGQPAAVAAGSQKLMPPAGRLGAGCKESTLNLQAVSCRKGSPEAEGRLRLRKGSRGCCPE